LNALVRVEGPARSIVRFACLGMRIAKSPHAGQTTLGESIMIPDLTTAASGNVGSAIAVSTMFLLIISGAIMAVAILMMFIKPKT
jgi:hypothetical protein